VPSLLHFPFFLAARAAAIRAPKFALLFAFAGFAGTFTAFFAICFHLIPNQIKISTIKMIVATTSRYDTCILFTFQSLNTLNHPRYNVFHRLTLTIHGLQHSSPFHHPIVIFT
jgi:hypothetical protein